MLRDRENPVRPQPQMSAAPVIRILLIDEDPERAVVLAEALQGKGYALVATRGPMRTWPGLSLMLCATGLVAGSTVFF